jgi:hypothetical protein
LGEVAPDRGIDVHLSLLTCTQSSFISSYYT